mgnify:FL=1
MKKKDPNTEKPEPGKVLDMLREDVWKFSIFDESAQVRVSIACPVPAVASNGEWDADKKQIVWDWREAGGMPPRVCYATWAEPAAGFQKKHLGAVVLDSTNLVEYALWCNSLSAENAAKWDAFVARLDPGGDLTNRISQFSFDAGSKVSNDPSSSIREKLIEAVGKR